MIFRYKIDIMYVLGNIQYWDNIQCQDVPPTLCQHTQCSEQDVSTLLSYTDILHLYQGPSQCQGTPIQSAHPIMTFVSLL